MALKGNLVGFNKIQLNFLASTGIKSKLLGFQSPPLPLFLLINVSAINKRPYCLAELHWLLLDPVTIRLASKVVLQGRALQHEREVPGASTSKVGRHPNSIRCFILS